MRLLISGRGARLVVAAVSVAICGSTTGCVRAVDPPPRPPASMPDLDAVPPEPNNGMARVIISTDVPARVRAWSLRVTSGSMSTLRRSGSVRLDELLCESTPCAVTLPYGDHRLAFSGVEDTSRWSTITIRVRRPTEVVNHVLGESTSNAGTALGIISVVAGAVLIGIGVRLAKNGNDQERATGRDYALGGLGAMLGGGLVMTLFPVTYHNGSTTRWSPEQSVPAARTIGGSVGVRF